jgi:lactoylglutathione lyase
MGWMIDIKQLGHIGIRVKDRDRSKAFYRKLGFEPVRDDPDDTVIVVRNKNDIEINFIVNASDENDGKNILMDVDVKYPGYTHVALQVPSIEGAAAALEETGIQTSGNRLHGDKTVAIFIRDPDRNVIEFVTDED